MCSREMTEDGKVNVTHLLCAMVGEVMDANNSTWQRDLMDACAMTLLYKTSRDDAVRERMSSIAGQKWRVFFGSGDEAGERSPSPVSVADI